MTPYKAHPLRETLNNEVHSRPPIPLHGPTRISYLAFVHADGSSDHETDQLQKLAQQFSLDPLETRYGHVMFDAGAFRIKWERHTEFSGYTFLCDVAADEPEATTALSAVPAE